MSLVISDRLSTEANKAGRKTESQIKEITVAFPAGLWMYSGFGSLVFGGAVMFKVNTLGAAVNIFGWVMITVGLFAFLRGSTAWNLRRKLLAAPVISAEGTVEFIARTITDRAHFSAITAGGRKLYPLGLAGLHVALPPGNYRFHFMNNRNWLLSAEQLSPEEEMRNSLNSILSQIFDFDEAVLEDSRRQAREGILKVKDGYPVLDRTSLYDEYDPTTPIRLGDVKFQIPNSAFSAMLPHLQHRVYYSDGERSFRAIEVLKAV